MSLCSVARRAVPLVQEMVTVCRAGSISTYIVDIFASCTGDKQAHAERVRRLANATVEYEASVASRPGTFLSDSVYSVIATHVDQQGLRILAVDVREVVPKV